jgi:hypothetical protein
MELKEALLKVEKAESNHFEDFLNFAKQYLSENNNEFTSEDIIDKYNQSGKPIPKEPRVWGAVIRTLSRGNLIEFVGYAKYQKASGHSKPTAIWRKIKQQ